MIIDDLLIAVVVGGFVLAMVSLWADLQALVRARDCQSRPVHSTPSREHRNHLRRRVLAKHPTGAILGNDAQQTLPTRPSGQPTPILRHPNSVVLLDTLAVSDFETRLDTINLLKLYRGY
jgi:hypothetical protein